MDGKTDFNGKRVFLSGPVTGMPDWNRKAFLDAEVRLREAGASHVYNPARHAEEWAAAPHESAMLATLHCLTQHAIEGARYAPVFDIIALLPGWRQSKGALDEYHVARACGIRAVEL